MRSGGQVPNFVWLIFGGVLVYFAFKLHRIFFSAFDEVPEAYGRNAFLRGAEKARKQLGLEIVQNVGNADSTEQNGWGKYRDFEESVYKDMMENWDKPKR